MNRTLRSGAPFGASLLHPVCQCRVVIGSRVWLFVPVGVLILLVLTNDLHQWLFAFQKDFVNSASNYTRQGVQCNHRVVLCADYGSVSGAVSAMQNSGQSAAKV